MADHAKRVIRMRDGEIYSDERQADLHGPPPRLHQVSHDLFPAGRA